MFIQPGDIAGAHQAHGDGPHSDDDDDSLSEEEDDDDDVDVDGAHHHHHHAFANDEEAALLEDELHMMEQELAGEPQEVRRQRGRGWGGWGDVAT